MSATVRVGTCSWADETLTKVWYPKHVRSGEARIRHYAERFDTVEANSTYYRLPDAELVANWAERTPDGFTMHVKAFGLMTRHPVKLESLPEDLRDVMPVDDGDEPLVEFRHRSWLDDEHRDETLAFLESVGATHVIVDAPKTDAKNLVPTVVAHTSGTAYVRFHGRNASTWNKRTGSAADRFDYLYSEEELAEWVGPLRELAGESDSVYAMFNNNGRSQMPATGLEGLEPEEVAGDPAAGEVAQAPANALMLRRLLSEA
jgi:uncharacterized protein YecE (DUF72 family)